MEDLSYAGQGPVMLDIGDDVGALIVTMPAAMAGLEVEISPAGARPTGHVPHVAVLGRPTGNGVQYAVVYSGLAAGSYDLNERYHERVVLTATVTAGEVTFGEWPEMASLGRGSHAHDHDHPHAHTHAES